jgi:hypothetical protein
VNISGKFQTPDMVSGPLRGQTLGMFTNFPVAPKQPRRVTSGQRAPISEHEPVQGAHRTPTGQRRPIGPEAATEAGPRPGSRRKVPPAYAKRRA